MYTYIMIPKIKLDIETQIWTTKHKLTNIKQFDYLNWNLFISKSDHSIATNYHQLDSNTSKKQWNARITRI